jgi:hypothetical protein
MASIFRPWTNTHKNCSEIHVLQMAKKKTVKIECWWGCGSAGLHTIACCVKIGSFWQYLNMSNYLISEYGVCYNWSVPFLEAVNSALTLVWKVKFVSV